MKQIGFIGLGAMGIPMAANLLKGGCVVRAFDIQPEARLRLASIAREWGLPNIALTEAVSPAAAADGADCVITIVPTSAVVETVLFGADGVASAAHRPGCLIDMTSGVPASTQALGQRLAALGIPMLDAPVSGGVPRARTGQLAIMVGGDATLLERLEPVLKLMGSSIRHVGALGAGQAMKALNNMASAGGFLIAIESLLLAKRFGLDPDLVVDVLNESTGMNNSTKVKFKQFVLSGSFASGFGMDLMVKDLGIAVGLAESLGAEADFSKRCLELWQAAQSELGPGRDHTEIARFAATHSKTPL